MRKKGAQQICIKIVAHGEKCRAPKIACCAARNQPRGGCCAKRPFWPKCCARATAQQLINAPVRCVINIIYFEAYHTWYTGHHSVGNCEEHLGINTKTKLPLHIRPYWSYTPGIYNTSIRPGLDLCWLPATPSGSIPYMCTPLSSTAVRFCHMFSDFVKFCLILFTSKPVVRAIEESHAACKDDFRQKSSISQQSFFLFSNIIPGKTYRYHSSLSANERTGRVCTH